MGPKGPLSEVAAPRPLGMRVVGPDDRVADDVKMSSPALLVKEKGEFSA